MAEKRRWIRVFRDGNLWNVKFSHCVDGYSALDGFKVKANAIDAAYRYARKLKPAKVRIFSATGKLQVDYLVA
jgi:hypothetical protein